METKKEIKLEKSMDLDFLEEIHGVPGGEKIRECIQCGTCSGSCPASYLMDYTPRQLIAMIRAGMREEVLGSDTIWVCASCYMCTVRCPKDIKITDIMYGLKRIAVRDKKYPKGSKAEALAECFAKYVNEYGRNPEMKLMRSFMLKTNPLGLLSYMPMGLQLMTKGRLSLKASKIKGINQIKQIINKVNSMEGL